MTCGRDNLTHEFLHIFGILGIFLLVGHIYGVFFGVVMSRLGSLTANENKVILHLLYEVVD